MRWKPDLFARLLAPYVVALVAVAASFYTFGDRAVESLYFDTLREAEVRQAQLIGSLLPWDLRGAALDRQCADYEKEIGARITVIAADGVVLGDSDAPSVNLENHGSRPEVAAALRDGVGHDTRVSASVKRPLYYQAWRQSRGAESRVIRLAVPMTAIEGTRHQIRRAIWSGVGLAALLGLWPTLLLARRLARRVTRLTDFATAVTRGEDPAAPESAGSDVLGRLETNLGGLAATLNERLRVARDEERKLAAVLGGMVEGVLVIGVDGTLRLANRAAEVLFELPVDTGWQDLPLIEAVRHPDLHALVSEVMRAHAASPPIVREMVVEGPVNRILRATATPLVGDDGKTCAFILVFHDITLLKQIDQSYRDFVANVSHELRTPLAAIRGYSETLLTGALEDPEAARRFLAIIERHAERLGRLVDDLLTLSDLELGRTPLRRSPTDADLVIDGVMEVMRGKATERGVHIDKEIDEALPLVDADPDRLEQAVLNLVDNSIKYTPPGGRVVVRARVAKPIDRAEGLAASHAQRFVEMSVADTGQGVPSQDLARLTERFFRVDRARSRELGGTGLGLAIVKQIVQSHGGWMRIESELGKGTNVHLFVPVHGEAG